MKILIGAPVRATQDWQVEAFRYYLRSLDALEAPEGAGIDRLFILHNSPRLKKIVPEGIIKTGRQFLAEVRTDDQFICTERTHGWNLKSLLAVTAMRNFLIGTAGKMGYDYYFMADSDLVLHPKLLKTLVAADKDIVAEAFWTRWTPEDVEAVNAWDYDMYGFSPDMETRFRQFKTPGLYRVGMAGACILISRPVLEAGITYNCIPNLSFWGEDRAFSIRAAAAGFEMWLDTRLPPIHLYRPSEVERYKKNL